MATSAGDLQRRALSLNDGSGTMPALGFGTLIRDLEASRRATSWALRTGFRHLDCAERYRNEAEVGMALASALADGVLRRDELFVTTKLWNNNHRPERVGPALCQSLKRLGLDSVELYLVHTPFAFAQGDNQEPRDDEGHILYDDGVTLAETWGAMEDLVSEGLCRSIGLSDIGAEEAKLLMKACRIKPAAIQVEAHPYLPQHDLFQLCQREGIVMVAFAPLGHALEPRLLDDPTVVQIARRMSKSPAQVLLAWGIQRGTAVLTTSANPAHIEENFDLCALDDEAMAILDAIETRHRFNTVPDAGVPGFIEPGH